jgi:hypothetical protein
VRDRGGLLRPNATRASGDFAAADADVDAQAREGTRGTHRTGTNAPAFAHIDNIALEPSATVVASQVPIERHKL